MDDPVKVWLDGGATVAAALLAGLHLYVFGASRDPGDQSTCYATCTPTGWVIVIIRVLSAIGPCSRCSPDSPLWSEAPASL